MLPKLINLVFITLIFTALTNGVRRKSKVDLPIVNAADAPLGDNIAIASSNDPQQIKGDEPPKQPVALTERPLNAAATGTASKPSSPAPAQPPNVASSSLADSVAESDVVDCDLDMIGFELITG